MARKSRKLTNVAQVEVVTAVAEHKVYNTALYARLSAD